MWLRNRSASCIQNIENNHTNDDHVPLGVVQSMKRRLLEKISASSPTKTQTSTVATKTISSATREKKFLSRSTENLQDLKTAELKSYLNGKSNVIIIENNPIDQLRQATSEMMNSDEVPKPGTVTSVKQMFEHQIRLSQVDFERSNRTYRQPNQSPSRSRSTSPNDMAIRKRRATFSGMTPTTTVNNQFPDLVISHTPSSVNSASLVRRTVSMLDIRPNDENHFSPTSDSTNENENLDFQSRLALFNKTNVTETRKNLPTSSKSNTVQFLTKPVLHHHPSSEKPRNTIEQFSDSFLRSSKSVTFFAGSKIDQIQTVVKKKAHVHFHDHVDTFEYLSYEAALAEYSHDDMDAEQIENNCHTNLNSSNNDDETDVDDDEQENLARTNTQLNSKMLSESTIETKHLGSLVNFRPSFLDSYERDVNTSDTPSSLVKSNRSPLLHESTSFDATNQISWSSMSNNADLLF